ncbi:MAG: chorismate synthase [Candidatus Riflebacteria bacterium]|nr:chorismate synthase [Candidatus Riflebacteria bacterium]
MESDEIEIISGIRFGKTIGSPIGMILRNADDPNHSNSMALCGHPDEYHPMTKPLLGHADLAGECKLNCTDLRKIRERASTRETAMKWPFVPPANSWKSWK